MEVETRRTKKKEEGYYHIFRKYKTGSLRFRSEGMHDDN